MAVQVGRSIPVTHSAYLKLEADLSKLRRERAERLALGEQEAVVEVRIARAEELLARAELVTRAPAGALVAIGSVVTVLDHESGRTDSYIVDGAHGPLESNVISALSPMGVAVIGREAGDVVSAELPSGRMRHMTILDVAAAAEST